MIDILENPKELKKLAEEMREELKKNPELTSHRMVKVASLEMKFSSIIIRHRLHYYLALHEAGRTMYIRDPSFRYAAHRLKELIQLLENGTFILN